MSSHSHNHSLAVELARRVSQAMRRVYPFGGNTTAMDFACGTGLVSKELAPYVKSIIGVDINQGRVVQYKQRVQNLGISAKAQAVCTLLEGKEGELGGAKFDVIVCASAYHHFTSIDSATRILSFFLKPGGSHGAHQGGFTEGDMRKAFEGAGLRSFSFEHAASIKRDNWDIKFFIAKGVK